MDAEPVAEPTKEVAEPPDRVAEPPDRPVRKAGPVWQALPWSLRYAGVAGACVLIVVAVSYLVVRLAVLVAPLTLAIIVAALLTALLQPVTELLCRLRAPRWLGALSAVLLLLAAVAGPGALLWRAAASQVSELQGQLAGGWSRTQGWAVDTFGLSQSQLDDAIEQGFQRAREAAPSPIASAVGVLEALGAAVLALILVFFLLKDGPAMAGWVRGLLPEHSRPRWSAAMADGWRVLARYARGMVVIAAVDAVGIGVALLVIGVPLALPLALLTFVAAFVPVLGATVAGAVAALVALAANGPMDALLVLAAVIAVQQAEGNLLEPLIMGHALRLHPAVVLIAVTAGALTAGVAGALIAVPLTAVIYRVSRTVLTHDSRARPDPAPAGPSG